MQQFQRRGGRPDRGRVGAARGPIPQTRNAGRMRLPPARTRRSISSIGSVALGSIATASARRSPRKVTSTSSMRVATPASAGTGAAEVGVMRPSIPSASQRQADRLSWCAEADEAHRSGPRNGDRRRHPAPDRVGRGRACNRLRRRVSGLAAVLRLLDPAPRVPHVDRVHAPAARLRRRVFDPGVGYRRRVVAASAPGRGPSGRHHGRDPAAAVRDTGGDRRLDHRDPREPHRGHDPFRGGVPRLGDRGGDRRAALAASGVGAAKLCG